MRNRTPDSSHRLYDELQSENTQALLDRLEAETDKEEIADTDLIEVILEMLDEKIPVDIPCNTLEEGLREFRAKYAPILDVEVEERKAHSMMGRRVIRVALAACLCVVMLFAVAQACGLNLVEQFLEWREETFVLRSTNHSGEMTLEDAPEGEFTSMAEVVATYGITDPVAPTWIPEGFFVQYVRAKEQAHAVNITARYTAGDSKIVQKILLCQDGEGYDVHAENSDSAAEVYEENGISFLLSSNNTQYRASWLVGNCTCSISGDLTKSEITHMIDSIFQ